MNIEKIKYEEPIGYLIHDPSKIKIDIYSDINWFRKLMLYLFFGLKYQKND
jgi:hypothetical protein